MSVARLSPDVDPSRDESLDELILFCHFGFARRQIHLDAVGLSEDRSGVGAVRHAPRVSLVDDSIGDLLGQPCEEGPTRASTGATWAGTVSSHRAHPAETFSVMVGDTPCGPRVQLALAASMVCTVLRRLRRREV